MPSPKRSPERRLVARALNLDLDRRRKPVALSIDGHNQTVVASLFPQNLAQQVNMLRDVPVGHDGVRPNLKRDFVSVHHAAVCFDEHHEYLEDPLGHRDDAPLFEKKPARHLEPELAEPVRRRLAA